MACVVAWQQSQQELGAGLAERMDHITIQRRNFHGIPHILVLFINVGPKSFKNVSYICQKSVRKLSI